MNLELTSDDMPAGCQVMRMNGEINMDTVQEFDDALTAVSEQSRRKLVLNFDKLTFITSSGVGVLVNTHAELTQRGGKLVLAGFHGQVEETLKLSGILEIIPSAKNEEEALRLIEKERSSRPESGVTDTVS